MLNGLTSGNYRGLKRIFRRGTHAQKDATRVDMTSGIEREVDGAKEVVPFWFMWAPALLIKVLWPALELTETVKTEAHLSAMAK